MWPVLEVEQLPLVVFVMPGVEAIMGAKEMDTSASFSVIFF